MTYTASVEISSTVQRDNRNSCDRVLVQPVCLLDLSILPKFKYCAHWHFTSECQDTVPSDANAQNSPSRKHSSSLRTNTGCVDHAHPQGIYIVTEQGNTLLWTTTTKDERLVSIIYCKNKWSGSSFPKPSHCKFRLPMRTPSRRLVGNTTNGNEHFARGRWRGSLFQGHTTIVPADATSHAAAG